jgi:hypothetical protein
MAEMKLLETVLVPLSGDVHAGGPHSGTTTGPDVPGFPRCRCAATAFPVRPL